MKQIDSLLQMWRFRRAIPWIGPRKRVLDIGCYRGELFDRIGGNVADSVGIDPRAPDRRGATWRLMSLRMEERLPFERASFDVITLLATAEHLPPSARAWKDCRRVLAPGGRLIITVPSPLVDFIVDAMIALRLSDGMDFCQEEHTGLHPAGLAKEILAEGFELLHHARFQFALNNLFVFVSR